SPGGIAGAEHLQALFFGFRLRLAAGGEADHDVDARIPQIERVRVALAAVADYGDPPAGEGCEGSVFFLKASLHLCFRGGRAEMAASNKPFLPRWCWPW